MHRVHRHNFAHWVVRKVKDRDALVLLTLKKSDAKKRDGIELSDGESKFAIVPIAFLLQETKKIEGHSDYLAKIAPQLEDALQE